MGTVGAVQGAAPSSPAAARPAPASRTISDPTACLMARPPCGRNADRTRLVECIGNPESARAGGARRTLRSAVGLAGRPAEEGWARVMSEALTVLYEDNHCLAVAKPA